MIVVVPTTELPYSGKEHFVEEITHPARFGELCDEFGNAAAVMVRVDKCNKQAQFPNGLQLGNNGSLKTPKNIGWLTSLITM